MGQSYRIRTELGITKSINVELDQEFEFLEILSLKLNQTDIYLRACSEYGVIVGRVTANNGLGLPNARVSIFIPIEAIDESNPVISSIYPYKSPEDKNEDGYRYNLLPYEKSYSAHAATGTLPTRLDVLTGNTVFEIYEKYYKFTAKTNESGDYMIMGVPLGEQTVVMDVDLSDIGEFSLTPQDLIRIGRATEAQVAGNRFRTSTDLNSLPQIVSLSKSVEISPLWGEPSICQIAINRVDFDLRDEANIDIQPTSVFMGSIYSSPDSMRIRPDFTIPFTNLTVLGQRPRDNFGNLCSLETGVGQILAIRQTINLDVSGNPILEQYQLEQNGNVIDENGAWLVELPMNLDYYVTNEFGQKVISYDPTIGIPTKAKYRFKVKWIQPTTFTDGVRRPYYLLPNVREYGWSDVTNDPNLGSNPIARARLGSSYYFGLDWSGYTNGFSAQQANTRINEIINCEDTFYLFEYNRVYTPSALIDQFKFGGKSRFIGIKEIDDNSCETNVNKFPVNEGFRNFDLLYFIVSLILQIFQLISAPLLVAVHFIAALIGIIIDLKLILQVLFFGLAAYQLTIGILRSIEAAEWYALAATATATVVNAVFAPEFTAFGVQASGEATSAFIQAGAWLAAAIGVSLLTRLLNGRKVKIFSLPAITYPDCEGCPCATKDYGGATPESSYSLLTQYSGFWNYTSKIESVILEPANVYPDDFPIWTFILGTNVAGSSEDKNNIRFYKGMESIVGAITKPKLDKIYSWTNYLPMGERINIFNTRKKYFDGKNRIQVSFNYTANTATHLDNTLSISFQEKLETGQLLTFVNPLRTTDPNVKYVDENSEFSNGISGVTLNPTSSQITVKYANPSNQYQEISIPYNLSYGSITSNYKYPSDIEYYQVVTAITMNEAFKLFSQNFPEESLPDVLTSNTRFLFNLQDSSLWFLGLLGALIQTWGNTLEVTPEYKISDLFEGFENQYLTILQRGVDPYSPLYPNKFDLNVLMGYPMGTKSELIITGMTRLNIPIQKLNTNSMTVQPFTVNGQNSIFYPSHFFRGGLPNSTTPGSQWSAFTTPNVGYYSSLDATNPFPGMAVRNVGSNYFNAVTIPSDGNAADGSFRVGRTNYNFQEPTGFYQQSEDLSGAAYFYVDAGNKPSNTDIYYYTQVFLPSFTANPMSISSNINNILRTDRLPSSDVLDGGSWTLNPALLQQNLNFGIYLLTDSDADNGVNLGYQTGAQQVPPDITGQYGETNVFESFECPKMVSLGCYEGTGTGFTINKNCEQTDAVVSGCYQFLKRKIVDIPKDIRNFNEWAYRFRFFYGLCRGVLSQSFTNNWVNGSLFMFPIQVDTFYDSNNKALPPNYPKKITYFDSSTNNFYFRSSPFISGFTPSEFIGRPADTFAPQYSLNRRNLLFPTTIMNLGMKDYFYNEIIFEPSTNAYVMNNLNSTSYSDTSDLVNLFVISRILNKTFLQQMLNARDNSVNSLFTRNGNPTSPFFNPRSRLDADLAQLMSINSEIGLIPFSPEYYPFTTASTNNAVYVYTQGQANPTIGVFYSSTTENLQTKDFLTPGVIDFRFNPAITAVTYRFGIKSQRVPFYQWQLTPGPITSTIFGSETNNWATDRNDIVSSPYQSLDRRSLITPSYFVPSNPTLDVNQRGYIFNKNAQGLYDGISFQGMKTKFMVGAPFHFYFGVVKGASALDKFKQKYLPNE